MENKGSDFQDVEFEAVYIALREGDVEKLKTFNKLPLLVRDEDQETPLSLAIKAGPTTDKSSAKDALELLLNRGASRSIFVKGYAPNTLVCTLPMAEQPKSSAFDWPKPIQIDAERTQMLDSLLAEHIRKLLSETVASKLAAKELEAKKTDEKLATAAKSRAPFNHYPKDLKVGDYVRRGPDWSYDDQDMHNFNSCVGIVKYINSRSYKVGWYIDVKDTTSCIGEYTYMYHEDGKDATRGSHHSTKKCDLYLVDKDNMKAKPKNVEVVRVPKKKGSDEER